MRKKKFRYETVNGEYVYIEHTEPTRINDVAIKPGSMRQLVGKGADGVEIYEDDAIFDTRNDFEDDKNFIQKYGVYRACLYFSWYIDWFDKPPENFLTTEEQIKKRQDYIKDFRIKKEDDRVD